MIKVEDLMLDQNNQVIKYHTYCLTCNDPTDTVLSLIEDVDKYQAIQIARRHEMEQGEGHSILVDYQSYDPKNQ